MQETKMRKAFLFGISLVMIFIPAADLNSQDFPKAELFGGFSYLRSEGENLVGWQASVAGNFHRNVGIVGDFGGQYENIEGVGISVYQAAAGPRFTARNDRVTAFGHFLVGAVDSRAGLFGLTFSDTNPMLGAGGGVDINVGRSVAIRVAQVDWGMVRVGGEWFTQNVRYGVGVVFKFGGASKGAPAAAQSAPSALPIRSVPDAQQSIRLGITGYPTAAGFEVTAVSPGSPAARLYLRPGDVIVKVNDAAAGDAAAIDAAVRAGGEKVRVNGLTRTTLGTLPFERETDLR
jgi:hypothetical protein